MSKRILTTDDSGSMRQMITLTLQNAGYQVQAVNDGVEACRFLENQSVDLLITDLNMPNMDGIELIRRVRAMPRHRAAPILMLTTESNQAKKMEGKAAGATGWIVKPFDAERLVAIVQKVLR